jgi:fumarate reductase flavoprotein subunit
MTDQSRSAAAAYAGPVAVASCDVLVAGGGLAGFAAALSAAREGANVLLVEKAGEVGGSTVLSGGSFAFAGTDLQAAQGIEDSGESLLADLIEVGGGASDEALVRTYVTENIDAYHWLRGYGVEFGGIVAASGQSIPRSHPADPRRVIEQLSAVAADDPNITVVTGTRVLRLIQEVPGGRVVGVTVAGPEGTGFVSVRRAVVLTTGGFAQDPELIRAFSPLAAKALRLGGQANTGDGLKMAWKLGAGLRDMPYVKGTFGNHPDAKPTEHTACMAIYKGAIAVNRAGRRFMDESLDYKLLGDICLRQAGAIAFQIFDQAILESEVPGYPMFEFGRRVTEGKLLIADSLEELAAILAIPGETLVASVRDYNDMVRSGAEDPLGRRHLTHHFGDLVTIERAPFYGYPSTAAVVATYAGITTDTSARVIDAFGELIPGLFAAGEVVGGFHGAAYMTGTSLGKATIFGRIAGRAAARERVPASATADRS